MTIVCDNDLMKKKKRNTKGIQPENTSDDSVEISMLSESNDLKLQDDLQDTYYKMPKLNPCRTYCKSSACFIISCIGLVMGLVILFAFDPLVNKILSQKLVILQGREGHEFWLNPPATIHRKMYIWHCTNPIEVQKGAIPEFVERGPYVYREQWNRSNIVYSDDLKTLSYIPITTLYFDRSQSIGSDDEYVTVINVPLMAMAHLVQFYPPAMQDALSVFIDLLETKLFINVTIKQLMEGYTDPLIQTASIIKPGVLKDHKFGILQARNGSYYQNFTINTGIDDITQVAKVITFNGVRKLNYWSTSEANMLNGTDGSLFPPNVQKDKDIYSYNADMCRSYYLSFLRERKDGLVTLYDYHLSSNVFNMSRDENKGFCGGVPCLGDGVLNISTCYSGVWGFISSPHFFQSDIKFREAVHGMQPDKNKHEFIMSFDPITSVPFAVNVRLQLSFYMPRIKNVRLLNAVKTTLVPIVWFDDEARLTPQIHATLSTLIVALNAGYYLKFIIPSLSLLSMLVIASYFFTQWRRSRRNLMNSKAPLLEANSEA